MPVHLSGLCQAPAIMPGAGTQARLSRAIVIWQMESVGRAGAPLPQASAEPPEGRVVSRGQVGMSPLAGKQLLGRPEDPPLVNAAQEGWDGGDEARGRKENIFGGCAPPSPEDFTKNPSIDLC